MADIRRGTWITSGIAAGAVPVFRRRFTANAPARATLGITALGVYEAVLNGRRVGQFIMAPGWTDYAKRLQAQRYDVTDMLKEDNELLVYLAEGWYAGRLMSRKPDLYAPPCALLAVLSLTDAKGGQEEITTDEKWEWAQSPILISSLYDGETVDARIIPHDFTAAIPVPAAKDIIISQEGGQVTEHERIKPVRIITTPRGETVLDFGQNMAGYVEFTVRGEAGRKITVRHAEILDNDGNFYTANLRGAKAEYICVLSGGESTFKPRFTYFGFRYVSLVNWPEAPHAEDFTAIAVYTDMARTGHFACGNALVNRLYENILWGQKSNFLDVPTDCPQRDERLGWTGDAQVFIRTACLNFDAHDFYAKWLHDLKSEQFSDGGVPAVIPNVLSKGSRTSSPDQADCSAAWGDAACVCPWQVYLSYGDRTLLAEQFASMRAWVEYIRAQGTDEALWNTGRHFGDWCGLDAPAGSYKGSTNEYLIATAMYANSTALLVKAGKALGKDMAEYETLYGRIVRAFQSEYMPNANTQTAYAVALYFNLCADPAKAAAKLAEMIIANGTRLQTGFVGTPYLLHALSANGYAELAYSLLLQTEYPSWLYPVTKGATTIWEHWDGLKEDGTLWSANMNSFNHYAYGAVGDWLYGVAAGITTDEAHPGYEHVRIAPIPDARLKTAEATVGTRYGLIRSEWHYENDTVCFSFDIPEGVTAQIVVRGTTYVRQAGSYTF
jgi:alpha-L-rhamnosidase